MSCDEEIGMQERDIIVAINRTAVSSVDDIRKIQSTLKPGDAVQYGRPAFAPSTPSTCTSACASTNRPCRETG